VYVHSLLYTVTKLNLEAVVFAPDPDDETEFPGQALVSIIEGVLYMIECTFDSIL
jgi:hypothetical protein